MIAVFVLLFVPTLVFAQPMTVSWSRTFGGNGDEYIEALHETDDGDYVVAGSTNSISGSSDFYLAKADASGQPIWQRNYDAGEHDAALGVEALTNGGFLVCGYRVRLANYNSALFMVRTDSNGDTVWTLTKFVEDSNFVAYDCGERAGGYWAAGEIEYNETTVGALWLISSTGQITAQFAYADAPFSSFSAAVRTLAGDYVLAGAVRDSVDAETDLWILKVAESGGVYWFRRIAHSGNDFVLSIAQLSGGDFLLGGLSDGDDPAGNHFSARLSASGVVLWTASYGGDGDEEHGHAVAELTNGDLAFVGHAHSHEGVGSNLHLVIAEPTGLNPEAQIFDGGANEVGSAVVATSDGGCLVAGYAFGDTTNSEALLVRFAPAAEAEEPPSAIAESATLVGCYPNPFNAEAQIQVAVAHANHITLKVLDLLGREVTTLISERLAAGRYEIPFHAGELPSGLYVARLVAGSRAEMLKIVLLK